MVVNIDIDHLKNLDISNSRSVESVRLESKEKFVGKKSNNINGDDDIKCSYIIINNLKSC